MATQLFLLDTVADTHLGTDSVTLNGLTGQGWTSRALATSRGSGVVASGNTATVGGPTAGVEVNHSTGFRAEWLTPPVSADVTISGTITANIWASESSMSANVAINVVIEIIRANATATRNSNTLVEIVRSTFATEVAVTTRAANNFTTGMTSGAYSAQTLNRGDRLRIRVFGDDAGTMASTFTFNIGYNGSGAAADGDSYVTFTETFAFESAPSGSQLFLTNTQSGLTDAPALVSNFTGSDENPLSEGGNWANLNSSGNPLQRVSNRASSSSGAPGASYWTPANFGPDLEAYATIVNSIAATGSDLYFRIQGEGGAGTFDGYSVRAGNTDAIIYRWTNAANTALITDTNAVFGVGDKVGVRCIGSVIQMWQQLSGSGTWNLLLSCIDTTYASAGKVGLGTPDNLRGFDDFFAATDSNLFTQQAWTSRGAGVVSYLSDTDAGWVAPLLTNEWYTKQLTAFTLTGMAQANIRALESNASANASLRCEIARVESDGSSPTVWASWCCAPTGSDNGELTTSEVARTINVSGDDLAISDGQRLRIRLYNEDISSAVMADAFNVQPFYNGTSAAASGDTYITLAQSVTESAPATLVLEHGFVNFNDPGVL